MSTKPSSTTNTNSTSTAVAGTTGPSSTPDIMLDEKSSLQLEREYNKLVSRNEELLKQLSLIRKIYTTLLRKKSSLLSVMELIDQQKGLTDVNLDDLNNIDNLLISKESTKFIPDLNWYNNQINILSQMSDMESLSNYDQITDKLKDSYELYKETNLIYNSSNNK